MGGAAGRRDGGLWLGFGLPGERLAMTVALVTHGRDLHALLGFDPVVSASGLDRAARGIQTRRPSQQVRTGHAQRPPGAFRRCS